MKISIITINFNNLEGLKKTVNSVINQTYTNIEYIVIDGASTDGSAEYIKEKKNHFNYWVSEPDKGIYNAMNKGIDYATGDYLLFLNSGDYFYDNDVINKVVNLNPTEDIVYGNVKSELDLITPPSKLSLNYVFRNSIPHQASFIKRELFELIDMYDENYKVISDWDFFMKAFFKFNCTYKYFNLIVSFYETGGISNDYEYNLTEKEKSLELNFPFLKDDLFRYMKIDNELDLQNRSRAIVFCKRILKSKLYLFLIKAITRNEK